MKNQITDSKEQRADRLRKTSYDFCQALLSPPEPSKLLQQYFVSDSPKITEHGPQWCRERLPFLAKTFTHVSGDDSCETYFQVLSKTLRMYMTKDTFPSVEGFIVDPHAAVEGQVNKGAVSVVGKAKFEAIKSGKSWEEQFIYRLSGFDNQGKIGHWEIWADPLSAWDAVGSGDS